MTDKAQALIERAMSTDSEHEALACIRKAKKHWKETPNSSTLKQQSRPTGGVSATQYNQVVHAYKNAKVALDKVNAENAILWRGALRATKGNVPNTAAYELAILKLKKQVEEQQAAKIVRTWFFIIVIFLMVVL